MTDLFLRDLLVSPYAMVKTDVLPADAVLYSMKCKPEIRTIELIFSTDLLDEDEMRRDQEKERINSPFADFIPPRDITEPPSFVVRYRLQENK